MQEKEKIICSSILLHSHTILLHVLHSINESYAKCILHNIIVTEISHIHIFSQVTVRAHNPCHLILYFQRAYTITLYNMYIYSILYLSQYRYNVSVSVFYIILHYIVSLHTIYKSILLETIHMIINT